MFNQKKGEKRNKICLKYSLLLSLIILIHGCLISYKELLIQNKLMQPYRRIYL